MVTLYPWQVPGRDKLVQVLSRGIVGMDLSATGIGKTFVALSVAETLGVSPWVICPKAGISNWRRVAEAAGIQLAGVANPEQVRLGKTSAVAVVGSKSKRTYRWDRTKVPLLIFDEAHRAGGEKTQTALMLAQSKYYGVKTLLLSATLSDKGPLGLRAAGYLAGFHNFSASDFYAWCLRNGCFRDNWNGVKFMQGPKRLIHLANLQKMLEPLSVRLTVDQVPGFPESAIIPELVDVDDNQRDAVKSLYETLPENVKDSSGALGVVQHLRARQVSEMSKVPIIADMVEDALAEGKSVAVFLCFLASIDALRMELLNRGFPSGEVSGQRKDAERQQAVDDFQNDRIRVIVNQVDSGGLSVSLHHVPPSQYPRMSIISPGYSATSFVQCLGRIHRAGALSKAIQKIVLMAGTLEENVYKAIQRKIANIESLTDNDLEGLT